MATMPTIEANGAQTATFAAPADRGSRPARQVAATASWEPSIDERLALADDAAAALAAIARLPHRQRAVITLRDVRSWESHEVCAAMGISEGNQRVLLHRARGHVRRTLR